MTSSSRGCSRTAQRLLYSSRPAFVPRTPLRTRTPCIPAPGSRSYAVAASTFKPLDGPSSHLPHVSSMPPVSPSREQRHQPADLEWKAKVKERNGVAARDIGGYRAYGEEGWNDEVLIGGQEEKVAEWDNIAGKLVEEGMGEDLEKVKLESREGEADKRSLARKMDETVYLVVKGKEKTVDREGKEVKVDVWEFPRGDMVGNEVLHTAAQRILAQTAGENMNTWIVGHIPIGSLTIKPSKKFGREAEKVFYMKGRIMAGQADLKGNAFGKEDFMWLTRKEIEELVTKRFWSQVGGMLGVGKERCG
ncbi:50s ribosomal subunit l30 [Botrytis cinerea]